MHAGHVGVQYITLRVCECVQGRAKVCELSRRSTRGGAVGEGSGSCKSHVCEMCGKAFSDSGSLARHMLSKAGCVETDDVLSPPLISLPILSRIHGCLARKKEPPPLDHHRLLA